MNKKVNSEVARSRIDPKIVTQLWGIAAGRCEICNQLLYIDPHFGIEGNYSENAHIHAVSKGGPRHKESITKSEINNRNNLILLCPQHHKTIDDDPINFKEGYILSIKESHESRIRQVTSITVDQETRIISYIAPIDGFYPEHSEELFRQAVMQSKQYPKQSGILNLNKSTMPYEKTQSYYTKKEDELVKTITEYRYLITAGDSISLFPFGLQPILIKLGTLLTDQENITVYQCHRKGHKWAWPIDDTIPLEFSTVISQDYKAHNVALVIDLSAKVEDARIRNVLGESIPIWHLTTEHPNRNIVNSVRIQDSFIRSFREIMEQLKEYIPGCKLVHLFPVMPTSLNVRLGMDYMPKTDLPILIYDQDKDNGGFFPTITIGG